MTDSTPNPKLPPISKGKATRTHPEMLEPDVSVPTPAPKEMIRVAARNTDFKGAIRKHFQDVKGIDPVALDNLPLDKAEIVPMKEQIRNGDSVVQKNGEPIKINAGTTVHEGIECTVWAALLDGGDEGLPKLQYFYTTKDGQLLFVGAHKLFKDLKFTFHEAFAPLKGQSPELIAYFIKYFTFCAGPTLPHDVVFTGDFARRLLSSAASIYSSDVGKKNVAPTQKNPSRRSRNPTSADSGKSKVPANKAPSREMSESKEPVSHFDDSTVHDGHAINHHLDKASHGEVSDADGINDALKDVSPPLLDRGKNVNRQLFEPILRPTELTGQYSSSYQSPYHDAPKVLSNNPSYGFSGQTLRGAPVSNLLSTPGMVRMPSQASDSLRPTSQHVSSHPSVATPNRQGPPPAIQALMEIEVDRQKTETRLKAIRNRRNEVYVMNNDQSQHKMKEHSDRIAGLRQAVAGLQQQIEQAETEQKNDLEESRASTVEMLEKLDQEEKEVMETLAQVNERRQQALGALHPDTRAIYNLGKLHGRADLEILEPEHDDESSSKRRKMYPGDNM
ncbi:hypothetical protein P280DRAFT_528266 [Massarina eburnea CBS 473.64]|uniref:Uncharacterized protein n=1 Tax=Massarina eburnea CBS 473.64 TaxID=1395130 RepID=A0A6A6RUJ8_9PLEO|nr:hypothetical protein P280DRAFT_528266 [Massarina eburnea CBS 473.64]